MKKTTTVASSNGCFLTLAVLLMIALVLPPGLQAQIATADIVGTVTDTSGGVVPDAKVAATNLGTGIVYPGQTASDGNFFLTQLPVGHYRVTISKEGFKTFDVLDLGVT